MRYIPGAFVSHFLPRGNHGADLAESHFPKLTLLPAMTGATLLAFLMYLI